MEKFIIEGGTPLSGSVVPAGNKNAALPALAASLLTDQEVVLRARSGQETAYRVRIVHAGAPLPKAYIVGPAAPPSRMVRLKLPDPHLAVHK